MADELNGITTPASAVAGATGVVTPSPLNEKLIACVLDHLENHPDEYDQNEWAKIIDLRGDQEYCGTHGCFAGWCVLLSTPVEKWEELPGNTSTHPDHYASGHNYYAVEAAKLLGLTMPEANRLFASGHLTKVAGKTVPNAAKLNVELIKGRLRNIRIARGLPVDGPLPTVTVVGHQNGPIGNEADNVR